MTREVKVGLTIIVAVVIFFTGIRLFQGLPLLRGTYEMHTTFENAGGLVSGNPVLAHGVKVGTVKRVFLDPETRMVQVTFQVDSQVTVPEGSTAEISGFAAFGGTSLNLTLGGPGASALPAGSAIPGRSTGLLGDITGRVPGMMARIESVLEGLDATITDVRGVVGNSRDDVKTTLVAFRQSAEQVQALMIEERDRLARLMAGAERALAGVETVTADAHLFAVSNQDTIRVAIQRANQMLSRMDLAAGDLQTTLGRIDSLTARVERGEGDLGRMMRDGGVVARADSAVLQITRILADFEREPGRYLRHLKAFSVF
jgi:phospholipid/cholesterol/gamma-HCH transport system substrate-binding protein